MFRTLRLVFHVPMSNLQILLLKKFYLDESENTNCITVNDRCNRSILNY